MSAEIKIERGPLDKIRTVNRFVSGIDELLYASGPGRSLDNIQKKIDDASKRLLSIGQELEVTGHELTPPDLAMPDIVSSLSGLVSEDLPVLEYSGVNGIVVGSFKGFLALPVLDDKGKPQNRIVQKIETPGQRLYSSDGESYSDFPENKYICAMGSQLRPVEPINAHSKEDLEGDMLLEWVMGILKISRPGDDKKKILEAMNLLNRTTSDCTYRSDHKNLQIQRLSWLKYQGVLADRKAVVRDYIDGTPKSGSDIGEQRVVLASKADKIAELGDFAILRGYRWAEDEPMEIVVRPRDELYVRAVTSTDKEITAPVRSILELVN